jgi:hypothetical protein
MNQHPWALGIVGNRPVLGTRNKGKVGSDVKWGDVCFSEFTFYEITFQTFLCLFAIRKVGQRKTLSSQRKHFSIDRKHFPVKEKFGLVSRKVFFLLAVFVFRKLIYEKPFSKLSRVCLSLEKLINGKHFPVKGKFSLVFRKVFSWKI